MSESLDELAELTDRLAVIHETSTPIAIATVGDIAVANEKLTKATKLIQTAQDTLVASAAASAISTAKDEAATVASTEKDMAATAVSTAKDEAATAASAEKDKIASEISTAMDEAASLLAQVRDAAVIEEKDAQIEQLTQELKCANDTIQDEKKV